MIIVFKSKDDLFSSIEQDKLSNLSVDIRYPLRFIFVNNFSTFSDIIKYLNRQSKLIELSSYLPHHDGWITNNELFRKINEIDCTSLVLPCSEILRFKKTEDFISILTSLFEIENDQRYTEKRIYMPMLGIFDRFKKEFYDNFHRKEEWAKIWRVEEEIEKQITIYQINFPIKTSIEILKNTYDLLNIWKSNRIGFLLSASITLAYLYKNFLPDTIFKMEEVSNYKVFIELVLEIKIPFKYYEKDVEYWEELAIALEPIKKNENYLNFEYYIKEYFNIKNILNLDNSDILKLYLDNKKRYSRWLLKYWILSKDKYKNNYLNSVISNAHYFTNDELVRLAWLNIFKDNHFKKECFDERKQIITFLHINYSFSFSFIELDLSSALKSIENLPFKEQSEYLTNVTFSEREHIINQFIKQKDIEANLPILEHIYPQLFNYLLWDVSLDNMQGLEWIIEYFKQYCYSKLMDRPLEKLIEILDNKNSDSNNFYDWYYNVQSYPEIKNAKVFWIDGLGAEWLSLILYFINKYLEDTNKSLKVKKIVKVNLPSTTDFNRVPDSDHLLNLDNFIHQEMPYQYPQTLIKQIDLVESIVKDKILKCADNKIIVVSDHGFTFLTQKKYGNFKKYNYENSEHEGRFLWADKEFKNDSNFLCHLIDKGPNKNKNVIIALKHTCLQNTPSREVHGGATPEEVLVPYIEISTIQERVEYQVKVLINEISIHSPILKIHITPNPDNMPFIKLNEKKYNLKKEENYWSLEIRGLSTGSYNAFVYVDYKYYKVFFRAKAGLEEEELF